MAFKALEDNDPMPFGKHKGTQMIDLPLSYLTWLLDKADNGNAKDWAKKNQQWIRAEAETGKHSRPTRVPDTFQSNEPPPPENSALAYLAQKFGTYRGAESTITLKFRAIADLMEEWKKLKPIPRDDPRKYPLTPDDCLPEPPSRPGGFFSAENSDDF